MTFWVLNKFNQPCSPSSGTPYNWHFNSSGVPCWNSTNQPCGWTFNGSGQPCNPHTGQVYDWDFDDCGNPCDPKTGKICYNLDGIVEGSGGNDVIDASYTGDPDGDRIDNNDAILPGEAAQDDIVKAYGGDDFVRALFGNDDVYAGSGNDTVNGGDGNDLIHGEAGNDLLGGDAGNDTLFGGDGHDTITGGLGDDLLKGGNGNDSILGGTGNDVIYGDGPVAGAGSPVQFTIIGESASFINQVFAYTIDPVTGAISNIQILTANADISVGQTYSYTVAPGTTVGVGIISPQGTFYSSGYGTNIGLNGDGDVHTKGLGVNADGTVKVGFEDLKDLGDKDFNDVAIKVNLGTSGATFDNTHYSYTSTAPAGGAGTGNDTIFGDDGNDTVFGGNGSDTVTGAAGADDLRGGNDQDLFLGGTSGDKVDGDEGGTDYDTLDLRGLGRVNVVYDPLNPENGSVSFLDAFGNPTGSMTFKNIENILKDPQRDGIVDGTAGNDVIDAAYLGDPQGDRIDNNDAILPGEAPQDDIVKAYGGNDLVRAGLGNDDVYGGTGNDTIYGGFGNDVLLGEDGDDRLEGDPGDDTLFGGAGNDTADGGLDNDTITLGDGNDTATGGDGNDVINTAGNNPLNDYFVFPAIPVDPTPNDDRDLVFGGLGNDSIITGDDADTIYGGDGADTVDAGLDADYIEGNLGNDLIDAGLGADTVYGGDGNDTITAGIDAFSDYNNEPFGLFGGIQDPNTDDGRDLVFGGQGNDTVITGDDADTIYGGIGNDTINAGIDDDYVEGGDGIDSIIGGHGSDTIYGGLGDDVIRAGTTNPAFDLPDAVDPQPLNGLDLVFGGDGNDLIFGEDDDDTLYGDIGNDTIYGGIDEDAIFGGTQDDVLFGDAGSDTLDGGFGNDNLSGGAGDDAFDADSGNDTMAGGDDRDTFTGNTIGDSIDGGEGGLDFDVLDLRGTGPKTIIYDPANPENGTVNWLDTAGNVIGTTTFVNIENVIPCFTPGTSIATPQGERLVQDLKVGDKIITRDNGLQEIRWVGAKAMDYKALAAHPYLKPVLIQKGALGNGLPERDMLVSPNHRMLVANDRTSLYFEEHEVLVAAKHLVNHRGVHEIDSMGTTYLHFMFDQHQVVLSNGAWTESFQPGDYTLKGMGNSQRNEIFELFPDLKTEKGLDAYAAARKTLKRHEAALLLK